MSQITGPYAIVAGTVVALNDPTGSRCSRVQILNGSGYTLTVVNGQGTTAVGPNTAATVLSQGGATITVTAGPAGSSGNGMLAEWLLPGDRAATPDGPLVTSLNIGSVTIAGGTLDVGTVSGPVTVNQATAGNLNALTIGGIPVSTFGTGVDGAVTISADTTLTRDMNYTALTVNAGVKLSTGGYMIRVTGTLTNNGTIDNSASGTVPGAAGSLSGGAPTVGTGAGMSPVSATIEGGAGGSAAAGGQASGGVTVSPLTTSYPLVQGASMSGGASGAVATISPGTGQSGAGGGVVYVAASSVAGNGTVSAVGGAGSASTPGTGSASAGGGGGGVVAVLCHSIAGQTLTTAGGAGATETGPHPAFDGKPGQTLVYQA